MAGHFYPPPPPFVGGSQPNARHNDIPQSGPAPQAAPGLGPMLAATFAVILSNWIPGPPLPQGSPRFFVPPPPAAPSQPRPVSQVNAQIIRAAWDQPPPWWPLPGLQKLPVSGPNVSIPNPPYSTAGLDLVINQWWPARPGLKYVGGGDTNAQAAVPSAPPPVSLATQRIIVSSWDDTSWTVIYTTAIAGQSIVSAPPIVSPAQFYALRSTWDAPWSSAYMQGEGDIAPVLPIVSQPPVANAKPALTIRAAWDVTPPLPEVLSGIAPLVSAPPVAQAPALSRALFQTIRQTWDTVAPLPPTLPPVSQSGPLIVAQNPAPNIALFYSLIDSWRPVFVLPPVAPKIATQPIVNAPPTVSQAPLANLVALNQPPAYGIPKAGTVASWIPPASAPSQPQPVSAALLNLTIRSWDPPVWWPLPSLALMPQSGPAPSTIVPVSNPATLRLILDWWAPAPLPVQPFQELDGIAPLIQVATPAAPLPANAALLRLLLQSWDASATLPPELYQADIAPLAQSPAPSQPIPIQGALLRVLVGAWDIQPPLAPQRRPVVTASGPVPQAPPLRTLINFRIPLEQWVLTWPAQTSPPRNPTYIAPVILTGGPRYIIRRAAGRLFDVSRNAGRQFKVSALSSIRFDEKDPAEAVKLTFDFAPDLSVLPGVLLSGIPTVTVFTLVGTDSNPSAIFNGSPGLNPASTQVIVPVLGGLSPNDYEIKVVIATTDALTILELTGILPVRA